MEICRLPRVRGKRVRRFLLGAVFAPLLATSAYAQVANEELVCREDQPKQDKYGYLRSLKLDLTGKLPTMEEYAQLDGVDDVPEAMIDAMLQTEEFTQRAVRRHRALLWNNIQNVRLFDYRTSFTRSSDRYWRSRSAVEYRGDRIPCADRPATFDREGNIEFTTDAEGMRREGYVEVEPYWAPGTTIKVCAFDAQSNRYSARGTDCTTRSGLRDPGCGCGPNLNLCRYGGYNYLASSFAKDVELRIADVIKSNRPYTEIFTSRDAWVNGPMVHYLKHQSGIAQGVSMKPLQYSDDKLPDLDFSRDYDKWVKVRLNEDHAGVLTSPAFLLRFQTNRARANRYFESFLCQPFSPPATGLPPTDPNKVPHPDLQQRDGCKYCHALLEPASAHWGRWTERGAGFLNRDTFPASREDCRQCGMTGQLCSSECRLFYITRTLNSEEVAYVGNLNAYIFLKDAHKRNVELGPKYLVSTTVVDNRFPSCTARRAMEGLFGRGLDQEEMTALDALGRRFVASGYSYRALVKAIVQSPVYRRVR